MDVTSVGFCPGCGAALTDARAFVQEFWTGENRHFLCWCPACALMCTVVLSPHLTATEPEH